MTINPKNWKQADYVISTDEEMINFATVHQFLKTTYWAKERSFEEIVQSVKNSLCFGMYEEESQIGFARVISDYTTFAYLADVFILPSYQKQGLGTWLLSTIFNMQELSSITSWMLLTNDAHTLYERVGFVEFPYPERVMMRHAQLRTSTKILAPVEGQI